MLRNGNRCWFCRGVALVHLSTDKCQVVRRDSNAIEGRGRGDWTQPKKDEEEKSPPAASPRRFHLGCWLSSARLIMQEIRFDLSPSFSVFCLCPPHARSTHRTTWISLGIALKAPLVFKPWKTSDSAEKYSFNSNPARFVDSRKSIRFRVVNYISTTHGLATFFFSRQQGRHVEPRAWHRKPSTKICAFHMLCNIFRLVLPVLDFLSFFVTVFFYC